MIQVFSLISLGKISEISEHARWKDKNDTSIIITNDNKVDFRNTLDFAVIEIRDWFWSNLLTLNYDKTYFLQFLTKKQNEMQQQIVISNAIITNINSTKFLVW